MFVLSKGTFDERWGGWDAEDGKFRVLNRFLFFWYRRAGFSFGGSSEHIIHKLGSKLSYVMIDLEKRTSISINSLLKGVPDRELDLKLNVLSEAEMYKNRMTILPVRYLIVSAFAGIGIYTIVKVVLSRAGVVLP